MKEEHIERIVKTFLWTRSVTIVGVWIACGIATAFTKNLNALAYGIVATILILILCGSIDIERGDNE